ncbi:uncharacterized protein LOC144469959 [Augochlora pura]
MHNNKRNLDKLVTQLLPPKLSANRRLDRPEDAKALGLRIPPDSENSSLESDSSSSKNSAATSGSKIDGKHTSDASRSNRVHGRHRHVEVKATRKLQDLKREEANEREQAMKKLNSIHAKLKRGFRSMSYKKTNRFDDSEEPKAAECSYNVGPAAVLKGSNRPPIAGKFKKNLSNGQENKADRDKRESKSMRQLFSMADSWSTDSIISHSDSCPCCHSRENHRPRVADVVHDT